MNLLLGLLLNLGTPDPVTGQAEWALRQQEEPGKLGPALPLHRWETEPATRTQSLTLGPWGLSGNCPQVSGCPTGPPVSFPAGVLQRSREKNEWEPPPKGELEEGELQPTGLKKWRNHSQHLAH